MNFSEAIDYLYAHAPMFQNIGKAAYKPDLGNIVALLQALGDPHKLFQSIHIAGTNGKGSSSHLLAAVLQSAGYKVGLYTSPHLKSFTERIRVDGQEVTESFVATFVEDSQDLIQSIKPSFFEITTAMAFSYFADQNVDIAIIEVGMGGRLDATNIISPILSLITNISYDHQEYLGNTLEKIAGEKAGIIKENTPVVISETQDETRSVFIQKAQEKNASIVFADQNFKSRLKMDQPDFIEVEISDSQNAGTQNFKLGLKGSYQLKNILGVYQCMEILQQKGFRISEQAIQKGFEKVTTLTKLKGRWQTINLSPLAICDTAHNVGGLQIVLKDLLKIPFENLHIVLGTLRDKELNDILVMFPPMAHYYFCAPPIPRALPAAELQNIAKNYGLMGRYYPSVNEAYQTALKYAIRNDLIFVGGSTFTVAALDNL